MPYIGDSSFNDSLESIKFPHILPEIKVHILRNIWAINMPRMQQIVDEMKGDYQFDTTEIAQEFFNNFMELWNVLAKHQNEGNYFRFMKFSGLKDKQKLQTRIFIRSLEVGILKPLLREPIPEQYEQEFSKIRKTINPSVKKMKIILGSSMIPFPNSKLAEWEKELDGIDETLEESFNRLGWLLVKIRQNNVAPKPPANNPKKNIGRNDTCPCGSGLKFKKCCWAKMN